MIEFLKKKGFLLFIFIPINIVFILLGNVKTESDILIPNKINLVASNIKLDEVYESAGSFNMVSVFTRTGTAMQNYLAQKEVYTDHYVFGASQSLLTVEERNLRGKISYNIGIINSIIYAFETADKEIDYYLDGFIVINIDKTINEQLKIGDIIQQVDGKTITNQTEFFDELYEKDTIELTLADRTITMERAENGYFGFSINPNYIIENTEVKVTIAEVNAQGGSGGLIQTLSLYDSLTEKDYTGGLKIVGTGTIDFEGRVGPIGGVKQKVLAADKDDADIFFVPEENYQDALEMHQYLNSKVKLVKVGTFVETVEYLENYGESND